VSLRRPTTKERLEALVLLGDAAQLIQDRRKWTRRALARDRHSHPVSPASERAVRWCLGGALLRAASERISFDFDEDADGTTWPTSLRLAFLELAKTVAEYTRPIEMVGSEEFLAPTGQRRRTRMAPWDLVYGLNDSGFRHETLLQLVLVTLQRLDEQIFRSARRRPKKRGGTGELEGGRSTQ
jgi:hypothetical protein